MRNVSIALTVIAALTLGALGTAEAQNKGRRDGAHIPSPAPMQHRASPRKFQHALDRRQARQHARRRVGRALGRSSKRIWRMKGCCYRARPGYRKHRYYHGGFRRPRRHHRHVYNLSFSFDSARGW
jgi:hypothetical protein